MHNPSIHECPKDCETCGKTLEDKKGCKEEFIKYCEKCPNREWKTVFVGVRILFVGMGLNRKRGKKDNKRFPLSSYIINSYNIL
ncbi:hypothetical protein ACJDU8_20845 [Clostridium sp. WILCCON 0269]|uniref:Uncharacterized protein n=1 Tax=Candidatus Clostridium eludens TaxID=3381663 RepID=A0ABW8SPV5_9CLOT